MFQQMLSLAAIATLCFGASFTIMSYAAYVWQRTEPTSSPVTTPVSKPTIAAGQLPPVAIKAAPPKAATPTVELVDSKPQQALKTKRPTKTSRIPTQTHAPKSRQKRTSLVQKKSS